MADCPCGRDNICWGFHDTEEFHRILRQGDYGADYDCGGDLSFHDDLHIPGFVAV